MAEPEVSNALVSETRAAWARYVDVLAPFRPQLHRYCRKLTGDIWDAEDLVQDTMLKGFAILGSLDGPVANPRGYLTRIATNLWIDAARRRDAEARMLALEAAEPPAGARGRGADRSEIRAAGAQLFERLAPQERAAVLLKDVFDMSLVEIAEVLTTSTGAVKAALHRGRGRLRDPEPAERRTASPALVDRFVERLDASDLKGHLALMLDSAAIEMLGGEVEVGRAAFEREGGWLWQSVHVHPDLPPDRRPPKWVNRRVIFHGEPIVLGFMPLADGQRLQGITRFDEQDGQIARIRSYCFSPETAAEIADALGLVVGWIPYRFPFSP